MQKRSHKLLASALLRSHQGFCAKRYELAFLFGSFQPDCNPLTYLKGSRRAKRLGGHNFSNSQPYIFDHIRRLQQRDRWTAFTSPHNEHWPDSLMDHHRYETDLRLSLAEHLSRQALRRRQRRQDLIAAIEQLHRQYMDSKSDLEQDIRYILEATGLLMAGCLPTV